MSEEIYIGGRSVQGEIVLAEPWAKYAEQGYRIREAGGDESWMPREFFERVYRKMTDEEQRLVLFGGDKWPSMDKPPLKINMIPPRLPPVDGG